ncbi:hypothetical protein NQ317_002890 [Molorchus minor]|uniref:Uncharacterized protein n=1 Tax=Molorchus minor TaxID=1323400 RepID=A0ABQ9JVD2_9CUCU|nr:hypothetical protein NQ317_002890 [Molorchus minor]
MPRKTELQTEEAVAAVGSPLRRSTRININSSAPTSLSSKGNLQSTNEPSQSKTRRASLQEIEETDDKKENKPAPRSRRGHGKINKVGELDPTEVLLQINLKKVYDIEKRPIRRGRSVPNKEIVK